jgi:hypothetical protein
MTYIYIYIPIAELVHLEIAYNSIRADGLNELRLFSARLLRVTSTILLFINNMF